MKTATFTKFRKNASAYFDVVEKGEKVRVIRHGKPIADICPYDEKNITIPSWKKPGVKLKLDGISLSNEIIKDRRSSRS